MDLRQWSEGMAFSPECPQTNDSEFNLNLDVEIDHGNICDKPPAELANAILVYI